MSYSKDLSGNSYGRWRVLALYDIGRGKVISSNSKWSCECTCGVKSEIKGKELIRGSSKSCGCLKRELASKRSTTHGKCRTKEYNAWCNMKSRCYSKGNDDYLNYGGRGIGVCERWEYSFENFIEDIGLIGEGLSLDRIDVNKDYSPDNCRLADSTTQALNRRVSKVSTSGVSGVCLNKKSNKWSCRITIDKERRYLGSFTILEDAIRKRRDYEIEFFGYTKIDKDILERLKEVK